MGKSRLVQEIELRDGFVELMNWIGEANELIIAREGQSLVVVVPLSRYRDLQRLVSGGAD